jgi:prepilin peptidase CpaA
MQSILALPRTLFLLGACALVLAAAWVDWREQRIPNRLVIAGLALGLAGQVVLGGWTGLLTALGGVTVGIVLMLPFYAIGGMGAGDVKLMGMVGAFLGPTGALSATVLTFLAGGVLAVAVALRRRMLGRALGNTRTMLVGALLSAATLGKAELAPPVASAGKLPYGVAIAAGTMLHVVLGLLEVEIF